MEMEKRKKNKRVIREDVVREEEEEEESHRLKKYKREDQEAAAGAGGSSGVPMEEEVEEFFAILRRMKVAVKYFDEKGKVGGKEWREALEQPDVTVVDDGELGGDFDNKKKGGKVIINEGLDLNAMAPEASESGGA